MAGVTSNYGYDAIYELTSVMQGANTTESYTYDAVGNRLSSLGLSAYSYNPSNELTSTSSASYTYDPNGNLTSKTDSTGTTNYTWDFENRLTSVALPSTGGTVTIKYDPSARRIYKSSASGTSVYVYDGPTLVEEANSSGAVVARYSQAHNIDEPLAMSRSGATSYYEADGLGSVTSLSTTAGALANTYIYDSFGNTINSTGSLTNSFRYTAREFDVETDLYYYRFRYYDENIGRFPSEDPIKFAGGIDVYDYVTNDPPNFRDPFGLQGQGIITPGPCSGAIFDPCVPPPPPKPPGPPPGWETNHPKLLPTPPSGPGGCASGRQAKCELVGIGAGWCVYRCDDGTTVRDASCVPYFYKPWNENFPRDYPDLGYQQGYPF